MSPAACGSTVITGGFGFLSWHLACRLRAVHGVEPVRLGRDEFGDDALLDARIAEADVIFHLAGVNRADTDEAVEAGNVELAERLAASIRAAGRPVHVVYGNSIQSLNDSSYGRGKARAALILIEALDDVGGTLADVLLPNLFGEHGKPRYNSFVATFCHALATGAAPQVKTDGTVPLLHAQRAAEALIVAAAERKGHRIELDGDPHTVSEVLAKLVGFRDIYGVGEIPPLTSDFDLDLFNTYRSYLFPQHFPFYPPFHVDARGGLSEVVRSHGGVGMAFVSTTKPGELRGDHYHLRKVERFFVASGEATIQLRRLYDDAVVTFTVSGNKPGFVDMPTMWVHNIRNTGRSDLITVFWADQLLDMKNSDQYPERVELDGESS